MFGFAVFGVGSIVACYILKNELVKNVITRCAKGNYKFNFTKYDIQGRICYLTNIPEPILMSVPGINMIYMFDTICDISLNFDDVMTQLLDDNHIERMNSEEQEIFNQTPSYKTAKKIAYDSLSKKSIKENINYFKNTINESVCVEIDLINPQESKSIVYFHYDEEGDIILERIEGEIIKYDDDLIIKIVSQMMNGNMQLKIPPEEFLTSERKQSLINLHDVLINLKDKKIDEEIENAYYKVKKKLK